MFIMISWQIKVCKKSMGYSVSLLTVLARGSKLQSAASRA